MKYIRFSIFTLICGFLFCTGTDAKTASEIDKAKKVFAGFFQTMGRPYNIGLPGQSLQKKLQPYFSNELAQVIKETETRESECIRIYSKYNTEIENKTAKGQAPATLKPPLIESSIFASQYEPPDAFKILSAIPEKNKILLMIEYTAYDAGTSANYTWKNKIELIHENGIWKIDDFVDINDLGNKAKDKNTHVKSFLKTFPSCKNDFKSS
jgi:hypothetical protein